MRDLSSFIQATASGLSNKVGDYEGLVAIMGHLMAIRNRQISNEQHFKPLKSTTELLKTYGQQLPENIYMQLEVGANAQIHTDRYIGTNLSFNNILIVIDRESTGAAREVEESGENCIHS